MQVLGKILYSIFCPGEPPPSDTDSSVTTYSQKKGDVDDGTRRFNKAFRATEKTLFTKLVENGILPKSICQLLSDMIDIGPNGTSDSPFTSFEDVIQDLEQMISQPQMFLHDSQGLRSPVFGQTYHGRKEEVATLMKVADEIMEQSSHLKGVQAMFVSGIAGSGKSYLVQSVRETLSSLGWIVVKSKFERSTEHASRGIISSMFDEIVRYLVKMKKSETPADVAYSQRASTSIMNSIGCDTLSGLVDFLPSLPLLFDGTGKVERQNYVQSNETEWQLVHSLKKILGAVLESGRFIMVCCDDLQWADKTTLSLISQFLVSVGDNNDISCHVLFVGMYRSNEIHDDRPFAIEYSFLQMMSSCVTLTKIELAGLSKEDIIGMLMNKLQLPQRLVVELADGVYKKTAGHALFVIELLNLLLRDSIVAFSSRKCRYTWDPDRISILRTGDSVAELIASNLKSLTPEFQQVLRILSCFGIQTDDSLLQILERFKKGIVCSIDTFIEQGVLDRAGPIVIFTHDLIQQAVYESMALDERKLLHLSVGHFLANVDAPHTIEPLTEGLSQLHLKDQVFHSGRNLTSTLTSLACDQVNAAGKDYISEESLGSQFAKWNLSAGQSFALQSNFSAALHYYSNGIAFLGTECWCKDTSLSLELHHSAVMSSFALGEAVNVDLYAQQVIDRVPFEDSIGVQQIVLKSLTQSDRHQECISRGIDIMRQLNFHIPLTLSNEIVVGTMVSTISMASQYSIDGIIRLCHDTNTDDSVYDVVRIMDAFYISLQATSSPYVPVIACEIVKFSLQNGVCPESAMSFATFALLIIIQEDYSGGKHWSDVARVIIKSNRNKGNQNKNKDSEVRVETFLHIAMDFYFMSPRNISSKLINCYHDAMEIGQADSAMICLLSAWRSRLLEGHNLSLILQSFDERINITAKHSIFSAKNAAIDSMLLMELTGKSVDCFSVFGDSICSMDDLRSEAESFHGNRWLYNFHVIKMLTAYWKGDYMAAEEHFHATLACPTVPQLLPIYHTFFGGLVALHLHRQVGGNDNQRLKQGKQMMEKMEKWSQTSQAVYENKWLLLKAEYFSSIGSHEARSLYTASINASQDHGNIHELALAFELLGNYYCSADGKGADSNKCFRKACVYYKQWGATAVAEKLIRKHDLRMDTGACTELRLGKSKNPRE